MTPEQLWKLAFRTCEAKIRKSGPVFSEAEIMAEFPCVGAVEHFPPIGFMNLFESRFKAAEDYLRKKGTEALFAEVGVAKGGKEFKCPTK